MNVELAVYTALYSTIVGDPALITALGTVRLHLGMPDEEAPELPYLAHRLAHTAGPDRVVRSATYYLDVYDFADTAERLFAAVSALAVLLDDRFLEVPGAVTGFRIDLTSAGLVPEPGPGLHHYAFQFAVRYARQADLAAILARDA